MRTSSAINNSTRSEIILQQLDYVSERLPGATGYEALSRLHGLAAGGCSNWCVRRWRLTWNLRPSPSLHFLRFFDDSKAFVGERSLGSLTVSSSNQFGSSILGRTKSNQSSHQDGPPCSTTQECKPHRPFFVESMELKTMPNHGFCKACAFS